MGGMGAELECLSKYLRHGVDASAVSAGPGSWLHEKLTGFLHIFSKDSALLPNSNHHVFGKPERALMPRPGEVRSMCAECRKRVATVLPNHPTAITAVSPFPEFFLRTANR
jgi:hypothetical protein